MSKETPKKTFLAEVRPGVLHPIPVKAPLPTLLLRHVNQFLQALFSKRFSSPNEAKNLAHLGQRYDHPDEIEYYKAVSPKGLYEEEVFCLETAVKRPDTHSKALVLGCGTGRECFGLYDLGFPNIIGIDISPQMIAAAEELKIGLKKESIQFQLNSLEEFQSEDKFDFIYFSFGLIGHTQGQKQRLALIEKARSFLKEDGQLLIGFYVRTIPKGSRFYWAERILQWRWGKEWEKGDTLMAGFGPHGGPQELNYFHFYENTEEIRKELESYHAREILVPDERIEKGLDSFWVIKKN